MCGIPSMQQAAPLMQCIADVKVQHLRRCLQLSYTLLSLVHRIDFTGPLTVSVSQVCGYVFGIRRGNAFGKQQISSATASRCK